MGYDSPTELAVELYARMELSDDAPAEEKVAAYSRCCIEAGRMWERHGGGDDY